MEWQTSGKPWRWVSLSHNVMYSYIHVKLPTQGRQIIQNTTKRWFNAAYGNLFGFNMFYVKYGIRCGKKCKLETAYCIQWLTHAKRLLIILFRLIMVHRDQYRHHYKASIMYIWDMNLIYDDMLTNGEGQDTGPSSLMGSLYASSRIYDQRCDQSPSCQCLWLII